MRTSDFHYDLPPELIAQHPAPERDQSRLMVFDRASGGVAHRRFPDFASFLRDGDVLVLNNSRVIPARLRGVNARTGGKFEILLLEQNQTNDWWAMMRPGKRAPHGAEILVSEADGRPSGITAAVTETNAEGHRRLRFNGVPDVLDALERLGEIPLPPYIQRTQPLDEDRARYQTVFAASAGSVAAPTAGLHFTEAVLRDIRQRGATICFVTLHVGPGTFAPVKAETLDRHVMHEERFDVPEETAREVNAAKSGKRRVIAVGTTTVRVLESVAGRREGRLVPGAGRTDIFIHPPRSFLLADALLTNFHLPCSTLLMLVSAFADPGGLHGRERMLDAYREAVRERYRFFSYGDAMLIL